MGDHGGYDKKLLKIISHQIMDTAYSDHLTCISLKSPIPQNISRFFVLCNVIKSLILRSFFLFEKKTHPLFHLHRLFKTGRTKEFANTKIFEKRINIEQKSNSGNVVKRSGTKHRRIACRKKIFTPI